MGHDERAHAGSNRTREYLRNYVFFPRMAKRIRTYVINCPIYRAAKPSRDGPKGLLQPIPPPIKQLLIFYLDLVTDLPLLE